MEMMTMVMEEVVVILMLLVVILTLTVKGSRIVKECERMCVCVFGGGGGGGGQKGEKKKRTTDRSSAGSIHHPAHRFLVLALICRSKSKHMRGASGKPGPHTC